MAGPLAFDRDRDRLESLPQRFDLWQLDARQGATMLRAGDQAVRPWMTVVVSGTEQHLMALELSHERPTLAQVWQTLLKAMREPEAGEPHRPTEVQVQHTEWLDALRPALQAISVECVNVEVLDHIDQMLEELGGQVVAQGGPSLLDMPGVTPEAVGSFFDAAALFFAQAPWHKAGTRPIQVESTRYDSGPWYGVLLGQAGMTRGLMLYDHLETLLRIEQGELSPEDSARLTAGLTVVFGGKEDLSQAEVEAVQRHGWQVAGPDAYPVVYRTEPGLTMRPPLAWELELLEGCLRAVPEFVRKKTRRLAPLSILVPVATGELPLMLSWATG